MKESNFAEIAMAFGGKYAVKPDFGWPCMGDMRISWVCN